MKRGKKQEERNKNVFGMDAVVFGMDVDVCEMDAVGLEIV
jgi:hypothetical protein